MTNMWFDVANALVPELRVSVNVRRNRELENVSAKDSDTNVHEYEQVRTTSIYSNVIRTMTPRCLYFCEVIAVANILQD